MTPSAEIAIKRFRTGYTPKLIVLSLFGYDKIRNFLICICSFGDCRIMYCIYRNRIINTILIEKQKQPLLCMYLLVILYLTIHTCRGLESISDLLNLMLRFKSLFNRNSLFRRNLFIKTEPTPNPNSLIYRPENRPILGNDSSTIT